jgi:hypothetical protein
VASKHNPKHDPHPRVAFRANLGLLAASLLLSLPARSEDVCVELIKGNIAVDVSSCAPFTPDAFDRTQPAFKFINDLDAAGRRNLYKSYDGLIVKGTIVRSEAVRTGISTSRGALQGEKTSFFIAAGLATCEVLKTKRIVALLNEQCCNGSADVPCLLETGYILTNLRVASPPASGSSQSSAATPKTHSKLYLDAAKKYSEEKYKEAIELYEKAEAEGDIDIKGLFHIGFAYRSLENCAKAIPPLEKIWAAKETNKIWATDDLSARRGVFLLARCHAKSGHPAEAIYYLNSFLLNAKKYKSELQQSLTHKDFGWIHTSKEYIEYKALAQRRLK